MRSGVRGRNCRCEECECEGVKMCILWFQANLHVLCVGHPTADKTNGE